MVCTALLIAEVNVNVICAQGTPGVGLIALAEQVSKANPNQSLTFSRA